MGIQWIHFKIPVFTEKNCPISIIGLNVKLLMINICYEDLKRMCLKICKNIYEKFLFYCITFGEIACMFVKYKQFPFFHFPQILKCIFFSLLFNRALETVLL